jgi:hypothetical protein
MEYVGIDWGTRRAAWCAKTGSGAIAAEATVPADVDGLARLAVDRGLRSRRAWR